MGTITKAKAGYKNNKVKGKCKNCVHFHPKILTCNIVIGKVNPNGGCNYYRGR